MKRLFYLVVVLLFLLVTCKKDEEKPKTPATDYMEYSSEGKIAAGGGKVTLEGASSLKGASVSIPSGVLATETKISIQVDNSKRPTGDSSSEILKFEPEGLKFSSPVTVKIPVSKTASNPKLYYFIPDSMTVQQIPILEFNQTEGYILAEINHFSRYYVNENKALFFDAWLYNTGNTIKAKIKFGGANGLSSVPVNGWTFFTSAFQILNAKNAIDYGIPYQLNMQYPERLYASIIVKLKGDLIVTSIPIKTIKLAVQRKGSDPKSSAWVIVHEVDPNSKVLFTSGLLTSEEKEDYFSGKSLIFDFETVPVTGKKYYLELSWVLATTEAAYWTTSMWFTDKFEVSSFPDYSAWTTSNMINSDPDRNKNFVDDQYDVVPNRAPAIPSSPDPANNATNTNAVLTLSWDCSDPDNDPLTYDVYFGTTNPPTTKVNAAQTAKTLWLGGLMNNTSYYWQIIAKDNNGNSTSGPIWSFTTKAPVGSAPVADFSSSATSSTVGQAIQFTDKSTNTPTSWLWSFGDGTSSTTQNPSHAYTSAGTYTVSLKATNSYGNNTKTNTNYITVTVAGSAPVADFTASSTSITVGQAIQFTDKSTNSPISWLWTFGDGTTSTVQNPSHAYTTAGTYTVSLKATNGYGNNTKTLSIVVNNSVNTIETGSFTDPRDGKTYKTVKIGTQWWMAENLAYIPNVSQAIVGSNNSPYYYVYDYNGTDVEAAKLTDNYSTYGVLYNWTAALNACPPGWHLPSDTEWEQFEMALGMTQAQAEKTGWRGTDQGTQMKSTTIWFNNGNGTNSSGFSALPSGYRSSGFVDQNYGSFNVIRMYGRWWSSSEYYTLVWSRSLYYFYSSVGRESFDKAAGLSVRCVKD